MEPENASDDSSDSKDLGDNEKIETSCEKSLQDMTVDSRHSDVPPSHLETSIPLKLTDTVDHSEETQEDAADTAKVSKVETVNDVQHPKLQQPEEEATDMKLKSKDYPKLVDPHNVITAEANGFQESIPSPRSPSLRSITVELAEGVIG